MSRTAAGPEQLPDPREEEVRRRLADARHVEPVPVDVATRLDRVLAQLAEGEDVPSSVDELAGRRRRRAVGLLAAAAAVTVVGLGLGQVLPQTGGSADSASGAEAGAVADREAPSSALGESEAGAGPHEDAQDAQGGQAESGGAAAGASSADAFVVPRGRPIRLRPERFAADALHARNVVDGAGRRERPGGSSPGRKAEDRTFFECTPADWGAGVPVPVLYDGEPHVLVFRAPAGDSQVADLLQCGTGEILRSTTLPAG